MKPLSMDLKERILAAILNEKETMPAIAVRFSVSHKMVQKIKYQYRDTGTLQCQNQKVGRKRILTERQCNRISKLISENPSLTLEQLRANLKVDCCLTTIWHELQRQHKTFKETLSVSEQHRTDVKAHRQRWKTTQRRLEINKLIFIDETGAKTNMTRRYG